MTKTTRLLAELFYYLDLEEESDNGRKFHPNYISSCRCMDAVRMGGILAELKQELKTELENEGHLRALDNLEVNG